MHLLIHAMNSKIKADNCTLQTSQCSSSSQNHRVTEALGLERTSEKVHRKENGKCQNNLNAVKHSGRNCGIMKWNTSHPVFGSNKTELSLEVGY